MAKNLNPNAHIQDFLDYFLSMKAPPHYAVLITGAWGIGKTHLIDTYLKDRYPGKKKDESKYVRISLYGVGSIQELEKRLLANLYPIAGGKLAAAATDITKSVGGYFGARTNLSLQDFLNPNSADIYVFDDLERIGTGLSIYSVLGFINTFCEQQEKKVLIIANEAEIKEANSEEYRLRREKLIGKTLLISSSFDQAFSDFLSKLSHVEVRTFLTASSEIINTFYKASNLDNLRILQRTLFDFERLYENLESKHKNNQGAMAALLTLFFIISFEFKAGKITESELMHRPTGQYFALARQDSSENPSGFAVAEDKYENFDLYDLVLSNEILVNVLSRGIVDDDQLREHLDQTSYFALAETEPSWKVLWEFYRRSEAELLPALEAFKKQFNNREFLIKGLVFQILGLRLALSKIGAMGDTLEDAVLECEKYIEDIFHKELAQVRFDKSSSPEIWLGYGNREVHEQSTAEFRHLLELYEKYEEEARSSKYAQIGSDLIKLLESDTDQFLLEISIGHANSKWTHVPIFSSIGPDVFLDSLLRLEPAVQMNVAGALKSRYSIGGLSNVLASEREWLNTLVPMLIERAESSSPFVKHQILNFTNRYLTPLISTSS